MKYAVIRLKGHQYKVKEGEEILVDHLDSKKIEPEVLLISEGDKVEVGKPVTEFWSVRLLKRKLRVKKSIF